jgi:hypothetical protein
MYTLIETTKLNGLDPEAYLRDVLGRIADHPINRIRPRPADYGSICATSARMLGQRRQR